MDNTPESAPTFDTHGMSTGERLARLERQLDNLAKMNLPQQLADLQNQVQQLQGQMQVQAHDLKLLNEQQRSFYQDLDQRLGHAKAAPPLASGTPGTAEVAVGSGDKSVPSSIVHPAVVNTPAVVGASFQPDKAEETQHYQNAVALLGQKKYDDAKGLFQQYLLDYQKGSFVANAHYWLGEIYLTKNALKDAMREFTEVVTHFPTSNKIADAQLKLAMIHVTMGERSVGQQEFLTIKKNYPGSTAAQLATIQLQQLRDTVHT